MRQKVTFIQLFILSMLSIFIYIFQVLSFFIFQIRSNLLYFWPNSYFLCWTHLVIHQSLPFVMLWIHSPCKRLICAQTIQEIDFIGPSKTVFAFQNLKWETKVQVSKLLVFFLFVWLCSCMCMYVFCFCFTVSLR